MCTAKEACRAKCSTHEEVLFPQSQRISVKLVELLQSDYISRNIVLRGFVKESFCSPQTQICPVNPCDLQLIKDVHTCSLLSLKLKTQYVRGLNCFNIAPVFMFP